MSEIVPEVTQEPDRSNSMDGERSLVAAILTNGVLDAVQPGADSRLAARRVVTLYQAILSELELNNLPAA